MKRFFIVLSALLAVVATVDASVAPAISDDFERPVPYRHAINAILGDLSFVLRFGEPPQSDTDPDLRVRTHLEFVHALLSRRDVSHLSDELRAARRHNLDALSAYIDRGVFPRNHLFADQNRPCFIDRDGRVCAAGYLIEQSAGRELAERINALYQSEFLWRMKLPEIEGWVAASGFTLLELCMIQPTYQPYFDVEIAKDADVAPATVSITGEVRDIGSCGIKYIGFEFGDGGAWMGPIVNSWKIPVDLQHTYDCPGTYSITGIAISTDWCFNLAGYRSWEISLDAPAFDLIAVQSPEGPPFAVYLRTTSDIRMDYLAGATVNWGDGGATEAAGWYADEFGYRTPAHDYASGNTCTVRVTNHYGGVQCTYSETGSIEVTPGTVPVSVSSWGAIKALYAGR